MSSNTIRATGKCQSCGTSMTKVLNTTSVGPGMPAVAETKCPTCGSYGIVKATTPAKKVKPKASTRIRPRRRK